MVDALLRLTPTEFERAVRALLRAQGFSTSNTSAVRATSASISVAPTRKAVSSSCSARGTPPNA